MGCLVNRKNTTTIILALSVYFLMCANQVFSSLGFHFQPVPTATHGNVVKKSTSPNRP